MNYKPVYFNLLGNKHSAESTDGLGLHIGGSRKLSSLSKHEVLEQLLQTLNGERMHKYQAMWRWANYQWWSAYIKQCRYGMHNIREWLIWTYVKREMQLWQTMGSLFLIYVLLVVFHLSSLHLKTKENIPATWSGSNTNYCQPKNSCWKRNGED